jgi:hypothetical protein
MYPFVVVQDASQELTLSYDTFKAPHDDLHDSCKAFCLVLVCVDKRSA